MPPQNLIRALIGIVLVFASSLAAKPPAQAQITAAELNFNALQPGQQAVVAVQLKVEPGFHAQSNHPTGAQFEVGSAADNEAAKDEVRFTVKLAANPMVVLFPAIYPPGKDETLSFDPKPVNVYEGKIVVYLPIQLKQDAMPGPLKLSGTLHYQACDDKSCYQPTDVPFTIETRIVGAGEAVQPQHAELFKDFDPTIWSKLTPAKAPPAGAQTKPAAQKLFGRFELRHNSYLLAFVAAFIAGIVFNAVPCVLPVLPLKAIGFYEVSQHNRLKSLAFGAVFSAGLIASFGVLALVIVVKRWVDWGEIYSNVYFNAAIVIILLVMAIGTFGAFAVQLPTAVYNITPRHDTYLGNFLFGILTAVLSTPCTFGLFLGLLVWAAGQPWYIGVPLVMTVGVGMASPYFLLSALPELARKFPRSGPWSELVKQLMAFLLLGSAVFFARRFIAPITGADAFWWTLFAVAAFAAIFMVGRTVQLSNSTLPRAIAFALALALAGGAFAAVHEIINQPYAWTPYSPQRLEQGQKDRQVVVVEFTAAWCTNCQFLEVHTLHSPKVVGIVKKDNALMLRADLTPANSPGWALLRELAGVSGIPYTFVYGPGASQPILLPGIYSADDLTSAIEKAAGKH